MKLFILVLLQILDCHGRIVDGDISVSGSYSSMALTDQSRRWGRSIRYFIKNPELRRPEFRQNITTAFNDFKKNVNCLNVEEIKEGDNVDLLSSEYILFDNAGPDSGCYSELGRQRGQPTRINLNPQKGCTDVATIKHELMHSFGFREGLKNYNFFPVDKNSDIKIS